MAEEKAGLATGIHAVAAAVVCSKSATDQEIALAGEILKRAPSRELPREIESPIGTFNRQMDAAIESCNMSAGEGTRAARRARLASDLERAGLVLIEQATLAELLERQLVGELGLEPFPDDDDSEPEELGAELLVDALASSSGILGLEYGATEGVSFLTHSPSLSVASSATSSAAGTTSVWAGDADPSLTNVND